VATADAEAAAGEAAGAGSAEELEATGAAACSGGMAARGVSGGPEAGSGIGVLRTRG